MNFNFTLYSVKCNLKWLICVSIFSTSSYAQVKFGSNIGIMNSDAVLELESSNRGLLMSRVTLESLTDPSPLNNHVEGMVVYNIGGTISSGFYYNDGEKWNKVSTSDLYSANGSLANSRKVNLNNFNLVFEGNGNIGVGLVSDPTYKLHVNGSIASTSGYFNLSDARFKKNVVPLSNALTKLMKLQGVEYSWNHEVDPKKKFDNNIHLGFLAQDIEKIFPEIVTTGSDSLKTKSIAYSDLIPVLVEAIKELKLSNSQVLDQLVSQNILFEKKWKEQSEKIEELKMALEKAMQKK